MSGGEQSVDGTDQIAVAKCPNCGYVYGDDLDYRFPNPSECLKCGAETENTTVADPETVRSLADDGLRADGGTVEDGTDRSECTDKACTGDAKYALWMGDRFSRVVDAHPAMSYDDGDLHPHVCETGLPRYERLHGDKGEFIRPVEKLAADGGTERTECWQCGYDRPIFEACPECGAYGGESA